MEAWERWCFENPTTPGGHTLGATRQTDMTFSYRQIFSLLTTIAFLTNCTTGQFITIRSDHSALVKVSDDSASFYKSSVIKNYISTKKSTQFTILNIDSLGNYLSPYFNKNYFKFQYSGDSLTFTDGYGQAFVDANDKSCCHHQIELAFDRPIKSIRTKNKFVRLKKNKVTILKQRDKFSKENTAVTIYLDK